MGTAERAHRADPAQHTLNLGGSLKFYDTDGWDFTANYDYEVKSDFDSHTAFMRVGRKF